MAAGLPVVAYGLPAYQKIYKDAYIPIPCFDKDAFADRIVRALDDKTLFYEMRSKGLDCSAQYGWDEIAKEDAMAL